MTRDRKDEIPLVNKKSYLPVMMSLQPVVVTKMLHLETASSIVVTSYPSMDAFI